MHLTKRIAAACIDLTFLRKGGGEIGDTAQLSRSPQEYAARKDQQTYESRDALLPVDPGSSDTEKDVKSCHVLGMLKRGGRARRALQVKRSGR